MINKEAIFRKAFEEKAQRLKVKKAQRQALLDALYANDEKLREISNELSSVGARIAITALMNKPEELEKLKAKSEKLSMLKEQIIKKAKIADIEYECNICSDTGLVSGKICDCIKKEASALMAEELSNEMPLKDSSFESFSLDYYSQKAERNSEAPKDRMSAILNICKKYADQFSLSSPNLLFMGSSGLGKTHLSLSIVKEVLKKGFVPVYSSAENLFSKIEEEKFSGNTKESYDIVLNADLLVIDDLGTEVSTSVTKAFLYNIINTRILSGKPTIISTNLTMKEIEEKYTARVASRLIGNYSAYKFLGNDIRQQKLLGK